VLVSKVFHVVSAVDWRLILPIDDCRTFGYSAPEVGDEGHANVDEENHENESIHD